MKGFYLSPLNLQDRITKSKLLLDLMSKDRYWYEKLVNSDCSGKFAPKGQYNNHTKGIRGKNKKETQCKNNTIQHEKFLQDALFG